MKRDAKFELDEQPEIALFGEELPPKSEVDLRNYHYEPCPQELSHVMPSHMFWHLFFSRPELHKRAKWMARLPKKIEHSIFSNIDNVSRAGWGIYIDEGPDFAVIFAFVCCGLLMSGVLALISGLMIKDIQSAFGVGSYFIALQTLWMTSLYFKWSQE